MGVEIIKDIVATPAGRKDGRRIWHIKEFVVRIDDTMLEISDFYTDFSSVPRWPVLWWLCGDTAHEGSAAHDWGYRKDNPIQADKATVDKWFLRIMEAKNEPPNGAMRKLMYWAVCKFANSSWHRMSVKDKL